MKLKNDEGKYFTKSFWEGVLKVLNKILIFVIIIIVVILLGYFIYLLSSTCLLICW